MSVRAIIFDLYFTLVRFDLDELDALFERVRLLVGLEPDEFARQLPPACVRYESGGFTSFKALLPMLPDLNTPSRPAPAAPGSGPSSTHTKLRT